jgi:hypothetical protein
MLEPLDISMNPQLQKAVFRPGRIMITYPRSTNWIAISWEDGKKHTDTMTLKFLHRVQSEGFKSSGRFYETSNEMLGMTPATYRGGAIT